VSDVTDPQVQHHVLSVLVENKAGVLARVSGLFARRGFNILSLAVAPTEDERYSRITMTIDVASAPLDQVTKQLNKLVNVLDIREMDAAQLDGFEDRLRAFTNFAS
jgi:acetolactate synthase-1/3 small subunit